ncbi:MAG: DUF1425 domain-containing protein [Phycisphaeraceae bacterium]|nr:DUF1425 domain-containing protein [Phycisphaeraceae bacterium]
MTFTHHRVSRLVPALAATLVVGLVASLAGGCKATNTVSSGRPISPKAVDMSYKVNNQFLASELRVISAYEQVRNGLTFVQINVRNEGAGDLWFLWQVVWTDRSGMRIPAGTVAWTREVLAERQEGSIEFAAPTPEAYDWRVTLEKWDR